MLRLRRVKSTPYWAGPASFVPQFPDRPTVQNYSFFILLIRKKLPGDRSLRRMNARPVQPIPARSHSHSLRACLVWRLRRHTAPNLRRPIRPPHLRRTMCGAVWRRRRQTKQPLKPTRGLNSSASVQRVRSPATHMLDCITAHVLDHTLKKKLMWLACTSQ